MQQNPRLDSSFKKEVFEGLTDFPKHLSSKYIYDKEGDQLFRQIMDMQTYYLTNCEREILELHKEEIAAYLKGSGRGFDLIELGAGDGSKTKILLSYLIGQGFDFVYKPIDISQNALDQLTANLNKQLPALELVPEKGEYFEILDKLKQLNKRKKMIVMLGSNIGNLLHDKAISFLSRLRQSMNPGDFLFMGFDQKKDPEIIYQAYSDPEGLTARFNKNILARINRELEANFNLSQFKHWESYDPETGTAKSYLVALEPMEVSIPVLDLRVSFNKWETIHTEISQKYNDKVVSWLADSSGLMINDSFSDQKAYYKDYILSLKN